MVAAGFEIHVQSRAFGARTGLFDRQHFGMRATGFFVPAFADHGLAPHDDAADARIWRRGVETPAGKRERPRHHGVVEGAEGAHFLLRRRGDFTSCTASRNSSGDSKLRYTEAKRI